MSARPGWFWPDTKLRRCLSRPTTKPLKHESQRLLRWSRGTKFGRGKIQLLRLWAQNCVRSAGSCVRVMLARRGPWMLVSLSPCRKGPLGSSLAAWILHDERAAFRLAINDTIWKVLLRLSRGPNSSQSELIPASPRLAGARAFSPSAKGPSTSESEWGHNMICQRDTVIASILNAFTDTVGQKHKADTKQKPRQHTASCFLVLRNVESYAGALGTAE